MQTSQVTRQSVSLPAHVSRQVRTIARTKRLSSSKVIADLVEEGLAAREREKARFFDVAERLANTSNRKEQQKLKAELARLTFGD